MYNSLQQKQGIEIDKRAQ